MKKWKLIRNDCRNKIGTCTDCPGYCHNYLVCNGLFPSKWTKDNHPSKKKLKDWKII